MSWMPKEKTSWSGRERERKGNPGEDKDKVKQGKEELSDSESNPLSKCSIDAAAIE